MQPVESVVQTERLYLRRFSSADADLIFRLDSDPEVMRYILPPRTREESDKYLADVLADYDRLPPGLGRWLAVERATGEVVGVFLLKPLENTEHVEVGYRLFQPYWGRGYATELTCALLRYGFEELGLRQIVGVTDPRNDASQHVLEKCGLRYQRMAHHYGSEVRFSTVEHPAPTAE